MTFEFRVLGVQAAVRRTAQEPEEIRKAAVAAVEATVERVRLRAVRRTGDRYNLTGSVVEQFVSVGTVTVRAGGASGSVRLKLKALPLHLFGARLEMRQFTLRSRAGRTFTRTLPTVRVAIYRGSVPKTLPGGFELRRRNDGDLAPADQVRRRIGAERGKLTGFRYFTFPRSFTASLLPDLQAVGSRTLAVELRAAYRKRREGLQVLRGNG